MKFNIDICPVCDSKEFMPFVNCTDFFVSKEEFTIKQCQGCGFKVTENIEDEENIGKYYQTEDYISHSNTSKGIINKAYHAVRKHMLQKKRKLVEVHSGKNTGNLLDYGCGTCYFLNEIKNAGWQVSGIEKDDKARVFAQREFQLDCSDPNELISLKDKSKDVVTLWHVLEHIHDLVGHLNQFKRILSNKGLLVLALPNHDSFDARYYKEFWAAYDVPRHIWHFNAKQISQLAERNGFTLKAIHTMPFDSFYVSMLSEKNRGKSLSAIRGMLLGGISYLNSLIHKKECSSLIYFFEKK